MFLFFSFRSTFWTWDWHLCWTATELYSTIKPEPLRSNPTNPNPAPPDPEPRTSKPLNTTSRRRGHHWWATSKSLNEWLGFFSGYWISLYFYFFYFLFCFSCLILKNKCALYWHVKAPTTPAPHLSNHAKVEIKIKKHLFLEIKIINKWKKKIEKRNQGTNMNTAKNVTLHYSFVIVNMSL